LQRDLFGVIAGSNFILNLTPNNQFNFFPMEILRLIEGPKNQSIPFTNFTNPLIFAFNSDLIKIQNGLSVGPYPVTMNLDTVAGGRYYYSKTIDLTNYHDIEEFF